MKREKVKVFDVLLKYWKGGSLWNLVIKFIFHRFSKVGLYIHVEHTAQISKQKQKQ